MKPFISKATGVPLAKLAARVMMKFVIVTLLLVALATLLVARATDSPPDAIARSCGRVDAIVWVDGIGLDRDTPYRCSDS